MDNIMIENIDLIDIDKTPNIILFPLPTGWALKHNQKYRKKGGKRLSKDVMEVLKRFFMLGQANSNDQYTASNMYNGLLELVKCGEINKEDVAKHALNISAQATNEIITIEDSDTDLESNSNENRMAISHLENRNYDNDIFLDKMFQKDDKLYGDLFQADTFIENLSQESSNQASSSYTLIEDTDHESLMSVDSQSRENISSYKQLRDLAVQQVKKN
ncbi:4893_t:CDS:2 [Dentiscutata heterogama]|uniref:4893_t:CDS:1 n=1 Tax=Dentiscutata heterogama TaxID=1316150 RepID=A0ACA9L230_9GLOM|nr:4893_t:CDS:2 [Dentiscutata heterogama]